MRSSISLEYRHRYYGNQARWLNASLLSKSDLRLSLDHRHDGTTWHAAQRLTRLLTRLEPPT